MDDTENVETKKEIEDDVAGDGEKDDRETEDELVNKGAVGGGDVNPPEDKKPPKL